ncbi:N-6 DNA methylase [Helicobacter mustelae]|nr:N-6 DNA methylase [Helicobacter mustelae]
MDTAQFQPMIHFIWGVADDLLRDVYVKGKYRDVILPMTVIRRLDVVLSPTKDRVLETYKKHADASHSAYVESLLKGPYGSNMGFYNCSNFSLDTLCNDPKNIRVNFENYLDGFSSNIKDIIAKFKFKNQLDTLEDAGILFALIERFCSPKVNFSIDPVCDERGNILHEGLSNLGMGYVFEELIRKFNEENNEEAGEHFTPREIIELMNTLVFLPIKDKIATGTFLIYDNACGSGGMLTESKIFITDPEGPIKSKASIYLYGQEINPETYALCKADMLIKGEDPDNIKYGSTLSDDQLGDLQFDFMLTNPPYGKSWEKDQKAIGVEKRGTKTQCKDKRFEVGITSKSDGQMMFLLNMLSKMKATSLGSRIASVHNGSSLFNSDSGQVAIRRHIFENDFLEAIIALPTNMFYNTGIPTFIWILTNRKPKHKKGKVQLINATESFAKMKKSLGSKQNEITKDHIASIYELFSKYQNSKDSLILDNEDFGYTKITIQKPRSARELEQDERFQRLEQKEAILEKLKILESHPRDFANRADFLSYITAGGAKAI